MHSAPAGLWEACPQSRHASPLPPAPLFASTLRPAHVTSSPPAKRITFYKSGDSQFGGVRMTIHKRSFKCFDALLDDLSQKVPLPFGVRTVTTPRGVHSIKHLEQFQDGGCYLCSDRRQVKPINMELAGKRPAIWHHHNRRALRPEAPLMAPPPTHPPHRLRRILLVRNGEPGVRRSVVLSRRSARSLQVFLEEISELMQFHVRKLYTVEGRKIDSVQSLMMCPSVLVCVGREPFSLSLVDFLRKSSEDKLPGLGCRTPGNGARSPATQGTRSPPHGARSPPHGARSRASEYSEGQESRKSVNFGLETKKSIIHPRSDSSNRSTRFSLSSEKSYPNGSGAWSHSQARPAIMNDDIEKRVLINKDGSLSVEMKVRFRLRHDETLQWSTEIKKSPPGSLTNDCCSLRETLPRYLQQGQSETCSDPDSADPEAAHYIGQRLQRPVDVSQCSCCYQHYDLWENPAHSHNHPAAPCPPSSRHTHTRVRQTHSSSSSSSCHARRVVRRRVGSRGGSASEQGRVVQEEMCVTEQVQRRVEVEQDGDTRVEVSTVSRCCSCSGVTATNSNLRPQSRRSPDDNEGGASQCNGELMSEGEERPLSVVSNSSHVLQTLQEDHDDEDDLPPSASRCCHSNAPSPSEAPQTCHTPCPPSHTNSRNSAKHRTHSQHSPVPMLQGEEGGARASRAVSVASSCHCGVATPHSTVGGEEHDRAASSRSKTSPACSHRSVKTRTPNPEEDEAADDEDEEWEERALSGLSTHTGLSVGSEQSEGSTLCPHCGSCERGSTPGSGASATPNHRAEESISRASQRSHHSHDSQCEATAQTATPKPATPLPNTNDAEDGVEEVERAASGMSNVSAGSVKSTQSNKSNCTNRACFSAMSNTQTGQADRAISRASNGSRCSRSTTPLEQPGTEEEEERPPTSVSQKSTRSHKSGCNGSARASSPKERTTSAMSAESKVSAKTSASAKSDNSHRSNCNTKAEERAGSVLSTRSAKSNVSAKSSKSHNSSQSARVVSPSCDAADKPVIDTTGDAEGEIEPAEEEETEERAASAMSAKSNLTAKSGKSHKSAKASERTLSPGSEAEENTEDVEVVGEEAEIGGADHEDREETEGGGDDHEDGEEAEGGGDDHEDREETEGGGDDHEDREETEGGGADHEDRAATAMSTKSKQSVRSNKSHTSVFNGSTRAESPISKTQDNEEEEGKKEEEADQNEGRAASALSAASARSNLSTGSSAKSGKSHRSNCPRAASPNKDASEMKDDTAERAPSTMSAKSNVSAKFIKTHMTNSETPCQGPNAAVIPTIKTDEGEEENEGQFVEGDPSEQRAPSCLSVRSTKSNISAKSSKSHRSTCKHADILTTDDRQEDVVETTKVRTGSAMSVKSTSSMKSGRSRKSHYNECVRAVSPNPNMAQIITIEMPEVVGQEGEDGEKTEERAASAARSNVSVKSTKSHKPGCSVKAAIPAIETTGADEGDVAEENEHSISSKTKPSSNPGAGRPQSSRSTRSYKCRCGTPSSPQRVRKEEDKREEEESSERATSALSSMSKQSRRASVCLGRPEDQEEQEEQADSHGLTCTSPAKIETSNDHFDAGEADADGSDGSAAKPTDIPAMGGPAGGGSDEEGEEERERAASIFSAKRSVCVKCSRSLKSPCNGVVKAASPKPPNGPKEHEDNGSKEGNYLKTASHLDTPGSRASSVMSSSDKRRSKSPVKSISKPTISETPPDAAAERLETQATSRPASQAKDDITPEKMLSVCCKSQNSLRPESAASAHSRPKLKASKEGKGTSQHLDIKGDYVKSRATSENGSVRSVRTAKSPLKPAIVVESTSGSPLSKSLSAADLLRETMAAERPPSCQSKASSINDKTNSEKSGRSHRSRVWNEEEAERAMTPACLPNASPNEVVSDWLRNIPSNGCMYTSGDGLNQGAEETQEGEEEPGEEGMKETAAEKAEPEEGEDREEEEEEADAAPPSAEVTSSRAAAPVLPTSNDLLPRSCHSSVAVMKVLLSPCLERCHSLPELSPVYGRRLSTSAKGLLDCLAQLQLIDPMPSPGCNKHKDRDRRYNEIVAILQSLWLSEPKDKEQVTPPRSSSGVDVRSGSGGSGKDNGHGGDETSAKAGEEEVGSVHEGQAAGGDEEQGETGQGEAGEKEAAGEVDAGEEEAGEPEAGEEEAGEGDVGQEEEGKEEADKEAEASSDRAATDAADRETSVPVEEDEEQQVVSPSPPVDGEDILDGPKATETPCSSDKSSANDASKSPTDTERETTEDSSSGGTAPLTKLKSQDPDPVWVLNLLNKLEKQFMTHYVDAMVEFKVRWDLDDSVVLNTMITELRDEVSRRIQSSIKSELRKIQGRAGRTGHSPRPPARQTLSRESTTTEKRRKMLQVLKTQAPKTADSLSDGELTPEFSDQRSDDEYCPCDACVRKKMSARPVKMHAALTAAPVMMEFDLRKILKLKKDPEPASVEPPPTPTEDDADEDRRNLEMVQEEEEEEEEDVIPTVVVEETTAAEEEEEEEGKAEEGEGEENAEDEGEKAEEEELAAEQGSEGREAENEEEEEGSERSGQGEERDVDGGGEGQQARCECGAVEESEEEEGGEAGEDGDEEPEGGASEGEAAEEEEEGGEIGEDGGEEGGKEEEELEECMVCKSKEEEGELTERESGGEGEGGGGGTEEDDAGGESGEKQEAEDEDDKVQEGTPVVCVTEGGEADAEDSDTDGKRPGDPTGAEDGEIADDIVEEFKPEGRRKRAEDNVLLHQQTKTSMESQPGSLEAVESEVTASALHPVSPTQGKGAAGGGQRRSRSPGRTKRRKPKESDVEQGDLEI